MKKSSGLVFGCFIFSAAVSLSVAQPVSILTYHYNNGRTGANTNETILTPANVNSSTFGKLFSYAVDGQLYAEPLYVPGVAIPGLGTHNVVYVATEHCSVYAFDADSNAGANAAPLWKTSFINPALGITPVPDSDAGVIDLSPEIGITSTPVIDPISQTIYVEAKTKEVTGGTTNFVHRLHALDITTGSEKFGGPVVIGMTSYDGSVYNFISGPSVPGTGDGSVGGVVNFNALREMNRQALLLYDGIVYLGFASHGDLSPYHGWLLGFNAQTLTPEGVYNSTPNGGDGGFWASGCGAAVDSDGFIYDETGNGTFNPPLDLGDSVVKLSGVGGLSMVDYFTPYDQNTLNSQDLDLGSAGQVILPDEVGSLAHPHLLAAGGKSGNVYLLDRSNLGQFNSFGDTNAVQVVRNQMTGGMWSTGAYFNYMLYYIAQNNVLNAYTISNAVISGSPVSQGTNNFGTYGATPVVSANGTSNGIVWALETDAYDFDNYASSGSSVLRAYAATNVAHEIYDSTQAGSRDDIPLALKFTVPTVANGKVYVGAQTTLSVFGVPSAFLTLPTISPNGGVFTNSVTVTLSEAIPGSTIYYTLDNSAPTTNSILYSGPFVLSNSVAIQVMACKTGAPNSPVATAAFLNSTDVGNGSGFTGSYYANQLKTFNDPPTLTRIDPTIDFDWNSTSPDPIIPTTDYTVRWTGSIQPQFNETYTFYTTTDDGVRLWVNNQLIIDHWVDQVATEWSGSLPLLAGLRYDVRMEYYQDQAGAEAMLSWSSPSTAKAIIPQSQLYPTNAVPPVPTALSVHVVGNQLRLSWAANYWTLMTSSNLAPNSWVPVSATPVQNGSNYALTLPMSSTAQFYRLVSPFMVDNTVEAPSFNPGAGNFPGGNATVNMSSATSGASIRYTTDGSIPTSTTGNLYGSPITLYGPNPVTLNAIAYQSGMIDSAVNSEVYSFYNYQVYGTNVYEAESGVLAGGATIYSDVYASGGEFVGAFNVGASDTFTNVDGGPYPAIAGLVISYTADSNKRATLYVNGALVGKIYWGPGTYDNTHWRLQPAIAISLNAGKANTITISQDPDDSGSWVCADIDKITVTVTNLVTDSNVVATPGFSPPPGVYTTPQSVTLSCNTMGATIRYTTNGSVPNAASTIFTAAINVTNTETINAFAQKSGMTDSPVASGLYTINNTVQAPTFNPPPGNNPSNTVSVMITSLTSGASIRYTTDGSTPSEITGTLYDGPVTLNGTNAVTLNAIAYHDGMTDSAVTRGIYTFTSNISATNVYEAENGVIVSPAQIYTDSHASGGEFVGDFNVGGSDTFTNVDGGSGRTASLVVSYTADSNKRATLYVNGTNMGKIYWGPGTYDNTNWRLQVVTNSFTLNPGPVNRIEISQDPDDSGSWVCADIDKITVIVSK